MAEPALGPYLRAIRSHKLVVATVTLAVLGAAILWLQFVRSPTYEATAQLLVTPLPQDDTIFRGLALLRDSGDPTRTVQTAANLVDSPSVARATAEELGEGWSTQRVMDSVEVEPQGESNILAITASADQAALAAKVANVYTKQVLEVRSEELQRQAAPLLNQLRASRDALGASEIEGIAELEDRINQIETVQNGRDPTLALAERAERPQSASGAGPPIILALALLAGLALGAGTAVLMELLDRRVRDEDEVFGIFPLPVLARIPLLRRSLGGGRTGEAWVLPPVVREAFRTLALQLTPPAGENGGRVVMVTSASTGDGKTTSAINLAASLSASGDSVILLDLDLRKPDVAHQLGLRQPTLLNELVSPRTDLKGLLRSPASLPSVAVLAPGFGEGDILMLEPLYRRLPDLVAEARELADHVIIDTPPLGEISDALRLLSSVDDLVVVVRPGNTDRASLATTADLLARAQASPTGFLIIGANVGPPSGYYGYGVTSRELFVSPPAEPSSQSSN